MQCIYTDQPAETVKLYGLTNVKKNLGARIRHFRELRNLGQRELAQALKVDKQTVWRWEVGRSWPEYDKLEAVCRSLDIRMEDLFHNIAEISEPKQPTAEQLVSALSSALADPEFRSVFEIFLRNHKIGSSKQ